MMITNEIKALLEETLSNSKLTHPTERARIILDPSDDLEGTVFVSKDIIRRFDIKVNKSFVVALGRNRDWYKLMFIEDIAPEDMISLHQETIDNLDKDSPDEVTSHFQTSRDNIKELMQTEGVKDDSAKPSLGLVPWTALAAIAKAFDYGAKKYATYNFTKGIKYMRLISAAGRHIWQYAWVEKTDPETGLSHLAHAGACICMALWMEENRPDLDDTYVAEKNK